MKRVLFIIIIVVNFTACESEQRLLSIDTIPCMEAYVGDRIVLAVSHTPPDALVPAFHFKTSNPFVASVNEQGAVICNRVGTCTIKVATADTRFSTTCTLNVKPNNELYDEPIVSFNTTKTAIKLIESDQTIVFENATMIVYQGTKSPIQQVIYIFDEKQKLISSTVKLAVNIYSELTSFMAERYDRYQPTVRTELTVWKGNNLEVAIKITNDACFVVYQPFLGDATCTTAIRTVETILSMNI